LHGRAVGDVTDSGILAYSPVEAAFAAGRMAQIGSAIVAGEPRMEQSMMESVLNCGANGWLMIAGGLATFLAGAALVKYLFSAEHSHAANP
jgi:hypothetical protein